MSTHWNIVTAEYHCRNHAGPRNHPSALISRRQCKGTSCNNRIKTYKAPDPKTLFHHHRAHRFHVALRRCIDRYPGVQLCHGFFGFILCIHNMRYWACVCKECSCRPMGSMGCAFVGRCYCNGCLGDGCCVYVVLGIFYVTTFSFYCRFLSG
jgi:hypothetical protein